MEIEGRLRKLERTNRLLVAVTLAALLAAAWTAVTGHANAEGHTGRIVADSIETRSLTVDNPAYGKQTLRVTVSDDGMVTLLVTDVKGEATFSLGSVNPVGEPSVCLDYRGVCRVAIGAVYRRDQPEFSIQLRDKHGRTIWMPRTVNRYTLTSK